MRREQLYLQDIVEAADAIRRFLAGIDEVTFLENELLQSGVLQKLIVIGEATARLPRSFCERHPEIEWQDIVGFRNIAVHEYFSVEWPIVWVTAIEDVPRLRKWVSDLLATELAGESSP